MLLCDRSKVFSIAFIIWVQCIVQKGMSKTQSCCSAQ